MTQDQVESRVALNERKWGGQRRTRRGGGGHASTSGGMVDVCCGACSGSPSLSTKMILAAEASGWQSKFAKSRDASLRCDMLLHHTTRIAQSQSLRNSRALKSEKNASNPAISCANWSGHDSMGRISAPETSDSCSPMRVAEKRLCDAMNFRCNLHSRCGGPLRYRPRCKLRCECDVAMW